MLLVPAGFVLLLWPWKRTSRAALATAAVGIVWVGFYLVMSHETSRVAAVLTGYDFGVGLTDPRVLRFPGVLQRIGACYLVAGLLGLKCGSRAVALAMVGVSVVYTVLMGTVHFNGSVAGSYDRDTNLARAIDVALFGPHAYKSYPDPEGLLSTLPAVTTTLLGLLAGRRLRAADRSPAERCAGLMTAGVALAVGGVLLGWWVAPINKQVWTPAYAVFTGGLAALTLGAMFHTIDVCGHRRWAVPFIALGMNAILVFLLSGAVGRMMGLIKLSPDWLATTAPAASQPSAVAVRAVLV
jgi:predicted acyltransferase